MDDELVLVDEAAGRSRPSTSSGRACRSSPTVDHVAIAGGVIPPVVDPVPVYSWSMLWRPGIQVAVLTAIRAVVTGLASREGWLIMPPGAWLPEPEASNSIRLPVGRPVGLPRQGIGE